MKALWTQECERNFFHETLSDGKSCDQLFYKRSDGKFVAYWEKGYDGNTKTLQSRNSFIGNFTENWTKELFSKIATQIGGYAIRNVACEEISLPNTSGADVAICKVEGRKQRPEDILMIIEVKMSIVWNWKFDATTKELICLGNYKTHQGNPSLLRSDTMLKAIGKATNIRISGYKAAKIPVIILGNTPITSGYYSKADILRKAGIIQGFWSVNADPLDNGETMKSTESGGFFNFDSYDELQNKCLSFLSEKNEFFCGYYSEKS